ncbi:thiamine pyrophosphate-binding protein [Tersicoccus phoenicis]|uniref:Thiamine pyrophosphate-binding protein n=1 Tax=Tersicoccus phoenicis TaxID=554083 RepID=A0A1R1LKV6_9MICC|nr:thiamine pyrophosphate-binding protein [Tersicoccus phoenicis]OMH28178.1 thiamine pyrophosphate-binding protein [Tersicoccus phoenicis]
MTTVSARLATVLAAHVDQAFALMGNGNAWFLDALRATPVRITAVRHETATVASADAYHRVCGRIAVATTTYGPGFTNALTALAEAAQARTPLLVITGAEPTAGPRPRDVDQTAVAAAVGVPTFTLDDDAPGRTAIEALHHALVHRTPVVLALPYDLVNASTTESGIPALPPLPAPPAPEPAAVTRIADLLAGAERPLILAGRGAKAAADELGTLGDRVGALTASSAPARGLFAGRPYDLGVAGGFASASSAKLIRAADVVLVVGAGLNQFTTAFGQAFAPDARVVQVDLAEHALHAAVTDVVRGDATLTVRALLSELDDRPSSTPRWGGTAETARDGRLTFDRDPGERTAPDGRLDPRSVMRRLNDVLPTDRVVVSDGGHFIGWANAYLELPAADSLTLVGTAFQSIGLGLPSAPGVAAARPDATVIAVIGDGGGLMGLPDLDSLARTAASAIVLVFNDAAYGAEVHQYGSQGLDQDVMLIDEVDFAQVAEGFGCRTTVVRTLDDLAVVESWVADGARGTFVADLRISRAVVAPYILEIIEATLKGPRPGDAASSVAAGALSEA